jgi:tetratricopeptide (TPR) repeat protein
MSRLVGVLLVFFLSVAAIAQAANDADIAATKPSVVFLGFREPDEAAQNEQPGPFLVRELVRQAFLIAARDECGLSTRDATLRETAAAESDPHVAPFVLFCSARWARGWYTVRYALSRKSKGAQERLWQQRKQRIELDSPDALTALAESAEALSRGELKEVLKKAGLGKPVAAFRATAAVPEDAEEMLWSWNELGVLSGVRSIHAEIRAKGESPELLAGLAIGYANLSTLTSYHFSPAQKAFAARALLYAERLLGRTNRSGWALWHRAYVRTLIGLHRQAEADVAAAKEKQKVAPATQQLPFWTGVINRFCQGKLPQMLEEAKSHKQVRLARYLNLEAVVYSQTTELTIHAAKAVIADCPDCLRGWDAMCVPQQLGTLSMAVANAFGRFSTMLRSQLPKVPGMPESIAKQLTERPSEPEEIELRCQLVTELKSRAGVRDTREPSLAALGEMIQEMEFSQLIRRLEFEALVLGVSTDATIANFRPLVDGHRFAALIDTFGKHVPEIRDALALLVPRVDPSELGYLETSALARIRRQDETHIAAWTRTAALHADPIFRDEMLGLQAREPENPQNREWNDRYTKMMWNTSSKLPAAVAVRITRDWPHAQPEAASIEKDFADDPLVMSALIDRYMKLEQFKDAERCAAQRIRVAPDYEAYRRLANIYKAEGDMVNWKETLEKSLQLPSQGLENSRVRNQIARYHMGRNEWKEALPYADGAAESGAAWAMLTAARCHEMVGEWEKSEQLMRAVSESYNNQAFEWMLWCHRTGRGDAQAADDCARKRFESFGTRANSVPLEQIGAYYLLRREPEKALLVFQKAYADGRHSYAGMHVALVADALGKTKVRDEYLQKVVDAARNMLPQSVAGVYGRVATLFQKALPPGSMKDFDFAQTDSIIQAASESTRPGDTNLNYFVAVFLQNRGETAKANAYLVRCAQTALYRRHNYVIACQLLRDRKIPIPQPNAAEPDDEDR